MQRRSRSLRDIHESGLRPFGGASAIGDADLVPIEPVRTGSRATSEEGILDGGWDGEVERVGGRRRLRGEVVALAAGLVFLAAAMLKPWAGPAPAPTASPTAPPSPPTVIAAVASPAVSAAPTRKTYPNIPPYDYRGPYPFKPTAPPSASPPVLANPPASWSAVDWSALSTTDSHADWGFATAVMASRTDGNAGPGAPSPTTGWVALGSPPIYSAVPLVEGQTNVYAIAVTWPSDLKVSRVTIVYLGGPEHPVYLPPPTFLPDSLVTPLPAVAVASPSAAPTIDSTAIRSGEFLIAPTDASSATAPGMTAAAWRSNPWPWPYGAYQVSVTSAYGTRRVVLDLLLTG